jgi:hypothetical protein
MPHVGCNAYVRRSDGGTAPNLVRRYGRWCADGLLRWSARVARRAGVRGARVLQLTSEEMLQAAFLHERRGFRGGAAALYQQQFRTPFLYRARNRAPSRVVVRRRLTPKFSRMRRRRNSPPRRALAPHVGCNATLGRCAGRDDAAWGDVPVLLKLPEWLAPRKKCP